MHNVDSASNQVLCITMATRNPRLTITFKPSTFAVINELSELTGSSKSAVVAELLEEVEPVLSKIVKINRAALQASDALRSSLLESIDLAQAEIQQTLNLTDEAFSDVSDDFISRAEEVARRASKKGSIPPSSNRGGRISSEHGKESSVDGASEAVWGLRSQPEKEKASVTPSAPTFEVKKGGGNGQ